MARLTWDNIGDRFFERGVDRGVVYVWDSTLQIMKGVAWNGLINVTEDRSGSTTTPVYLDGVKYLDARTVGDFSGTITAFTYPREFSAADGIDELYNGVQMDHQPPELFHLSYRTKIGNDVNPDLAYKLHLLYNLTAVPTNKSYGTIGASVDLEPFSWSVVGVPPQVVNHRPTCHFIVDSRRVSSSYLSDLETRLYGTDGSGAVTPKMPDVSLVMTSFNP